MENRDVQLRMATKIVIISLLLNLAEVTKVIAATNYDFSAVCETGQTLYYKIKSSTTVELTTPGTYYSWSGYTKPTGNLILPETVEYNNNSYSVTGIGTQTFYGCSGLTSITISNSITTIGNSAFSGCNSASSITIGNSVTSIGESAFYGCNAIGSVVIPNSVISVGNNAFYYCNSLTSITIGNSVVSIGTSAFSACHSITSIIIPNSVTSIGSNAFSSCINLSSITLGNSVASIGGSAFEHCYNITSITLPASVTLLGEYMFSNCSSLEEIVVESGNQIFDSRDNCNAIIRTIDNELIFGCKNSVIPNSVTSIGSYAFGWCNGLVSMDIPNSVTSIGNAAFIGCGSLESVVIPTSVSSISDRMFSGCSNLTLVNIHNFITSIGEFAFENCIGLTSLFISNAVTSIGEGFLYGCYNIEEIVVESGNPVYDSRGNSNAIIKTIDNELIQGCKNTIIPQSVTSIGNSAFRLCSTLTSINIPNNVTSIGNYAFSFCSGLTSLIIPNSVISIGHNAFQFCSSLNSISLSCSLSSVDYYAFAGCTNLSTIIIGNSTTTIVREAFYQCSNLSSVIIGSSINQIWYEPFAYCDNLSSLTILATTPPRLDYSLKSGSTDNLNIYVPFGKENAYKNASYWNTYRNKIQAIPNNCRFVTAGNWSTGGNWLSWRTPNTTSFVCIEENAEVEENVTIANLSISEGKTLTIKSGCTLIVTGNIIIPSNNAIIIENGGQLIHNSANIQAEIQKSISGYVNDGGWHLITSPLANNTAITSVDNLFSNNYDLYQYDEPTLMWKNQKAADSSFVELKAGRGYLYANSEEVDLKFTGTLNGGTDTINIPLIYSNGINHPGFNLVGNPFPCNAYLNREYYILTTDGTDINPEPISATTPIPPCTAVFVKAVAEGETVVFTRVAP